MPNPPPRVLAEATWASVREARYEVAVLPCDHAGELETSVMQYLAGDLVKPLTEAGAGIARKFKVAGLRDGWAWARRRWTQVTADTGAGDPRAATPEKGRRYFEAVTAKIGRFLPRLFGWMVHVNAFESDDPAVIWGDHH